MNQRDDINNAKCRKRPDADVAAFLAYGGEARICDSSGSAAPNFPLKQTRPERVAFRKRLDGSAIAVAIASRSAARRADDN